MSGAIDPMSAESVWQLFGEVKRTRIYATVTGLQGPTVPDYDARQYRKANAARRKASLDSVMR